MNFYVLIKNLHITCAVLSACGFALRGYWMCIDSDLLGKKLTRILPHINDTLLLISAITLVVLSQQYPLVVTWVTMKIVLLLLYIVLGTLALKLGKTKSQRIAYFMASLITVAGIFFLAVTKPG